jgi:diketogulonate reductase-like aldo/keto reductase
MPAALKSAAGMGSFENRATALQPPEHTAGQPGGDGMEWRSFGPMKRAVAVIGQGSWYIDSGDRAAAIAALRRGLDLGMNHIDAAEIYGGAEEIVGQAIAGRRNEVFLVSKVLPAHATRKGTITACEGSLARLRTDRLDCYLLNWRGAHPLEQTVAAFDQLQRQGKILSWGVSNFALSDLEDVWKIACGGGPACNQVLYHLRERTIERDVLPWCERHGVALVAYRSLGQGNFPAVGTMDGRVLETIAAAHGATPRQVALRFLVRHPLLFVIPKAARAEHTAENAGAGELRLTAAEIDRIERAFPLDSPPRHPVLA